MFFGKQINTNKTCFPPTLTHTLQARRPWSWCVSRFSRGGRTCGLVEVDICALARRGGLHRQGPHAAPLSPGRRRSSLAGLLLRMREPIPRPRGCSETGHVGYGPPTGWHRWRLPSSHLTSCFRTCVSRPCERLLQGQCSGAQV